VKAWNAFANPFIADSADMSETPGTVRLVVPEEIGGASFSIHSRPLGIWVDFIRQEVGCSVILIWIQPKSLETSSAVSPEISRGIHLIVETLAV
jgi:Ni,Fe-hydrogenase maturation factor